MNQNAKDFGENMGQIAYLQLVDSNVNPKKAIDRAAKVSQIGGTYCQAAWNYELSPSDKNKRTLEVARIKFLKLLKKYKIKLNF